MNRTELPLTDHLKSLMPYSTIDEKCFLKCKCLSKLHCFTHFQ
uniref:Bm14208 n=1 Tax=Brugia malayi TaxID=6279 RepID=A0A1I9G2D9_BRUMA|nr:Bm14208 [Brugia malayi]